jgi:transposase
MPSVPYDFQCPYKDSCPQLEWLSTQWALEAYQRAEDSYDEHIRIVDNFYNHVETLRDQVRHLERENAELKAKLKLLHQQQFKPNKKKDGDVKDEKDVLSSSREKKKRGAPLGHPAWTRPKPEHIDRIIHVPAPTVCPFCQKEGLKPMPGIKEHVQEDIVIQPLTVVTQYLHDQAFCSRCNRPVVQAGKNEILNAPIGPVAKSVAVYLRYRIGISYRKTTELFHELFGLKFVPASAVGFDRKATARGDPLYEDLRVKIRSSEVVHADETSWRNDGLGHFVWFAGHEQLAFYHIDRHRSARVAKDIFGENFEGAVVRDRYAAYNDIGKIWQSCLAHIITKAKEIIREHDLLHQNKKEEAVNSFCNHLIDLCRQACDVGQGLKSGHIQWDSTPGIKHCFIRKLNKICKLPLKFKPAETLRSYLAGPEKKFLFTFLDHPGVPPTNNHAEQSLRHMVIFRKICFGNRSDQGIKTHSVLPSLVQTARRQNVNPRQFLQILFTSDIKTSQAALFNNSA